MKRKLSMSMFSALSAASVLSILGGSACSAFVLSNQATLRREGGGDKLEEGKRSRFKRLGASPSDDKLDVHRHTTDKEHNFALRLQMQEAEAESELRRGSDVPIDGSAEQEVAGCDAEDERHSRRVFLSAMLSSGATATAAATSFGALHEISSPPPANALERSFPEEIGFLDGEDTSRDLSAIRGEIIAERKAQKKKNMDDLTSNPTAIQSPKDLLGSAVWAGALWLLSGSRSNPLVTPLANVVYDEDEEQWLKDRNEGLFAPLPPGFLLLMGLVFTVLGVITDRTILFLAEGDASLTLQLAGVALIGGGSLELGRIASGEKKETREDAERKEQLEGEFLEFAEKRLNPGGNCHRSEVVGAFRRFFAKYRVENEEYPLTDLEIERLLRNWNRMQGNEDMSSAGFFTGVQINDQADIAKL